MICELPPYQQTKNFPDIWEQRPPLYFPFLLIEKMQLSGLITIDQLFKSSIVLPTRLSNTLLENAQLGYQLLISGTLNGYISFDASDMTENST